MLLSPWNSGKHFWPHAIFFFFTPNSKKMLIMFYMLKTNEVLLCMNMWRWTWKQITQNIMSMRIMTEGLRFLMSFIVNLIGKLRKAFKILWIHENSLLSLGTQEENTNFCNRQLRKSIELWCLHVLWDGLVARHFEWFASG